VPAVVRRFEEHRLPELVVAAVARDPDVSHTATTCGSLPGRLAQARCPAHLCPAGPQLVTERTGFRLIIEQRNGHLNDGGLTGGHESMIIVTCTDDPDRDPGPCRVTAQRVWCWPWALARPGITLALRNKRERELAQSTAGQQRGVSRESAPETEVSKSLNDQLREPPKTSGVPHKNPASPRSGPPPQTSHGHAAFRGTPRHSC